MVAIEAGVSADWRYIMKCVGQWFAEQRVLTDEGPGFIYDLTDKLIYVKLDSGIVQAFSYWGGVYDAPIERGAS